MAKVVLIRPPSMTAKWVPAVIATPPLAHAYLAGTLTHHGHEVKIIDAVGENLTQKTIFDDTFASYGLTVEEIIDRIPKDTDLIGISSMFTQEWPNIKRLATAIRTSFPKIPIVCGGEHMTAEPDFSLRDCPAVNYAVLGEGEETLLTLIQVIENGQEVDTVPGLAFLKNGEFKQNAPRARIQDLDKIPWPRWDLTPIRNYLDNHLGFGVRRGRTMPMLATRGCPYKCTFCSNPQMWGPKWIARDPHDVIREIEHYIKVYDMNNVDFYDLTAIVKKEWIVTFANLLIEKNLNITWQLPSGTRSEALDDDVCELLYKSGCRNMTYAPESGSDAVLTRIKKRVDLDKMIGSMSSALRHGINTKYNLIFGFPGETHREVFDTYKFIIKTAWIGVYDLSIWLFSPYPGSELFQECKRDGKIKYDSQYFISLSAYSDFSNAVSWNPKMSAKTLKFYRLFGTLIFYAVSYLSHPQRIYQLVRNIATGKHESKLETVLAAMWDRFSNRKLKASQAQ